MRNSEQSAISVKISIANVEKLPADDQTNWDDLKQTQEYVYIVGRSRKEL